MVWQLWPHTEVFLHKEKQPKCCWPDIFCIFILQAMVWHFEEIMLQINNWLPKIKKTKVISKSKNKHSVAAWRLITSYQQRLNYFHLHQQFKMQAQNYCTQFITSWLQTSSQFVGELGAVGGARYTSGPDWVENDRTFTHQNYLHRHHLHQFLKNINRYGWCSLKDAERAAHHVVHPIRTTKIHE